MSLGSARVLAATGAAGGFGLLVVFGLLVAGALIFAAMLRSLGRVREAERTGQFAAPERDVDTGESAVPSPRRLSPRDRARSFTDTLPQSEPSDGADPETGPQ